MNAERGEKGEVTPNQAAQDTSTSWTPGPPGTWPTWHPSTWSLEFPQGLQRHSEKFAPSLPQLLSAAFSDLAISFTNSNNCIHTRPQSTRKLASAIAGLLLDRGGGALLARPQRRISSWCGTSSVMGQQLSEGVLMSAMLPRFGE